jgi:hypothetical protein
MDNNFWKKQENLRRRCQIGLLACSASYEAEQATEMQWSEIEGPVKIGVLYLWLNNIRNKVLFYMHFVLICTVVVLCCSVSVCMSGYRNVRVCEGFVRILYCV